MSYSTPRFQMGPEITPSPIKNLILTTCIVSLFVAFINNIFVYLFNTPGPMEWLSLSWWGMTNYLWWQPLTYLFVHRVEGVNLSFLVNLTFNMYILWVFGTDLFHRKGRNGFLSFYFFTGILSGLLTLLLMPLIGQYGMIAGSTPSIIALVIAWTLLNPDTIIFLFFLIPIKAKWLTLGILGSIILINLSNLDFIHFTLYFSAAIISYFYSLIAWGLHSPFPALASFELAVTRTTQRAWDRILRFLPQRAYTKKPNLKNVFDIHTGQPIQSDDQFIDAMLEKISTKGEQSLTWHERKRMEEISTKKRKDG